MEEGLNVLLGEGGAVALPDGSAEIVDALGRGRTVLRVAAVPGEAEVPYAALHALLLPVLDRLDDVVPCRRAALRAALGIDEGGADPLLVGAAVRDLLVAAAPAVAVVDGVIDTASAAALAFAGRRLERTGVTLVVAGAALDGVPVLEGLSVADLAWAAWNRGRADDARRLVAAADGVRAEHLRGVLELRCGVATTATHHLETLAGRLAATDPSAALRVLLDAGEAAGYAGDLVAIARILRAAHELAVEAASTDPEAELLEAWAVGMGRLMEGDADGGVPLLRDVIAAGADAAGADAAWRSGVAATTLGDEPAARRLHGLAVERARANGDAAFLPHALEFLVNADLFIGRYDAAVANAEEGVRLARAAGQPNTACHHVAYLALIAAMRGQAAPCRAHAAAALDHATIHGLGLQAAIAGWALALLDLARGRAVEARDRLVGLAAAGPGAGHPLITLTFAPTLVEAAARAGDRDTAEGALAVIEAFADRAGWAWSHGLVARCRGLLATGAEADAHFGEAVRLHARAGRLTDRARTELLWGESLRRERRRVEARARLRSALETFERLQAEAWAERARAELRATGETIRRERTDDLTPREREIADRVGSGRTNREIAAELFLSPRTVDHHLRQVFVKLGIASRAELIRDAEGRARDGGATA